MGASAAVGTPVMILVVGTLVMIRVVILVAGTLVVMRGTMTVVMATTRMAMTKTTPAIPMVQDLGNLWA
jgi:hypothetical protein